MQTDAPCVYDECRVYDDCAVYGAVDVVLKVPGFFPGPPWASGSLVGCSAD